MFRYQTGKSYVVLVQRSSYPQVIRKTTHQCYHRNREIFTPINSLFVVGLFE